MADRPQQSAPTTACPSCGCSEWIIPSAVQVELRFEATGGISAVVVNAAYPIGGEGDIRCGGCDELLLDWSSRVDDDAAWKVHHDERRPLWDELHSLSVEATLPGFEAWSLLP